MDQNKSCGVEAGSVACLDYITPVGKQNPCETCAWWREYCNEDSLIDEDIDDEPAF